MITRFYSVLVGYGLGGPICPFLHFSFQLSAFSLLFRLSLGAGVLSRHTVTFVDNQRLAKVQPATFPDTTRHQAATNLT